MNGFEALEFFSSSSQLPDLVLLDVMMPGMDGFEVLKEIREEKNISQSTLPIIMLSAMEPIDQSVIKSLKHGMSVLSLHFLHIITMSNLSVFFPAGANDYVSKPFDPDVLLARVKNVVEMKRLRQVSPTLVAWFWSLYSTLFSEHNMNMFSFRRSNSRAFTILSCCMIYYPHTSSSVSLSGTIASASDMDLCACYLRTLLGGRQCQRLCLHMH